MCVLVCARAYAKQIGCVSMCVSCLCSNKKETADYFLIIVFVKKKYGGGHAETIACHHVAVAKKAICLIGNTVRVEGR